MLIDCALSALPKNRLSRKALGHGWLSLQGVTGERPAPERLGRRDVGAGVGGPKMPHLRDEVYLIHLPEQSHALKVSKSC